MNPYQKFVSRFSETIQEAKSFPLGGFTPLSRTSPAPDSPKALFFSPHPDDECISGGIALRLLREGKMNVINVAVTQGSKKERQAERLHELKGACNYIGFGLVTTGPNGLEGINPKTRTQDCGHWSTSVKVILEILEQHRPQVIMFPHEHDWNSTHIGTYFLVMDALKQMAAGFEPFLIETEFWGQMTDPNLMIEISAQDLTDMISALTFHVGEVQRNPYHLLLPAWMLDNVRRGAELVGGQGAVAPDFTFAALNRLRRWRGGKVEKVFDGGKLISHRTNIGELFK
jgi:LmbE family N-acetylglucosaminyl deacetylase